MADDDSTQPAPSETDAPAAPPADVIPETSSPLPEPEPPPNEPTESAPTETQTAQIPASEPFDTARDKPLREEPAEPLAPATAREQQSMPEPTTATTPTPAPLPSSASATNLAQDLLVKARATIQDRKRKKLEKILEALNEKGKITNDEVEKLLHVSDATATRYLATLEREGKIKQVGKTGKSVGYTRN